MSDAGPPEDLGGQDEDLAERLSRLDAEIELLTRAAVREPGPRNLWSLVLALADRAALRPSADDRDAAITWGLRLLDLLDAAGAGAADQHDLLGGLLLDRAEESGGDRRPDLDAAIAHLEAVLAATPPEAAGRAQLLALLAHACWLRLDGDASRHDDLDKMIAYATQAWRRQEPGDEIPPLLGCYLAIGLQERLRRPGQPFDLEQVNLALEVLERTEPLVADDPDLHLIVVTLLGFFLVGRGQQAGSPADLAAAQPWLFQAADQVPAGDPQFADVTQLLATSMFLMASLGMGADQVDRAIVLLTASVQNPIQEADRAMMTRAALGMALIERSAFAQSGQDLDAGIAHLAGAYEMAPAGDLYRIVIAWNLGSAMLTRFMLSGDVQDRDAARFYLDVLGELTGPAGDAVRELISDIDVTMTAMRGLLRLAEGMDGDQGALNDAVRQLREALAMVPAGHPHRDRLRSDLGLALAMRASRPGGSAAEFREATSELSAAVRNLPPGHLMRQFGLMRAGAALAAAAYSARNPELLRAAIGYLAQVLSEVGSSADLRGRLLAAIGAAAGFLHELTADPGDLDAAQAALAEACQELARQPGHPQHASALIRLAWVHRTRGDQAAARETGLAALRARGREVLLQTGTARSLGFARMAAAEAADIAAWCLDDGKPAAAVDALELGRGLILHAATSVADVPALLTRAGHQDLAAEWQAEASSRRDLPWDAGPSGTEHGRLLLSGDASLEIPSGLRARVLAVLAGSAELRLLAPPARAQTAAALARTGADALVYLLGPGGGQAGRAILVPAGSLAVGSRPQVLALPALRDTAAEMAGYAAAYAAVLALPGPPPGGGTTAGYRRWSSARERAIGTWKDSLVTLCAWAWPAVMGPVLGHVGQWGLDRPPRLVLIPVGRLSLVPWHAAFGPPGGQGRPRHACAQAVISYAASGRQLTEVSRRPALDPQAAPVIVGNPTLDLPFAGLEACAIRERCYPAGRYLGFAGPLAEVTPDGPGLPSEVLGLLPSARAPGASMIHLGCHADVTGSAPGRSYLVLAGRQKLMIDAVLRRAGGRPPMAPGGLVALAACRSDLAAEEYDEALTLATAFLAAGAVTVVAARWEVPDGATSLMMFMFHYFMTARAAAPRDALRMAQLWMLDPGRAAPAEMPAHLAAHASRGDLADVTAWAALTHQGR